MSVNSFRTGHFCPWCRRFSYHEADGCDSPWCLLWHGDAEPFATVLARAAYEACEHELSWEDLPVEERAFLISRAVRRIGVLNDGP